MVLKEGLISSLVTGEQGKPDHLIYSTWALIHEQNILEHLSRAISVLRSPFRRRAHIRFRPSLPVFVWRSMQVALLRDPEVSIFA